MHPFRQYINQYEPFSEEEWLRVDPCITRKTYPKNHALLVEGQRCEKLWFTESGLVRFFTFKNGEDVTKFFTVPPYCFTAQKSFTTDAPAAENISTLEASVIWEMSKKDAFGLLDMKSWAEFIRKLIQEVQFNTEQLYEDAQNRTAEDRYIEMLEQGSPILNRVPLKYLASYLGIAPQSLSRIRKKYASS
ncbi:MAG: Crp/Fnr family transcriptional regulator [Bacteroidota bacterium]